MEKGKIKVGTIGDIETTLSEKVNDITFEGKKYYISCRGWVKDKQEAPQE